MEGDSCFIVLNKFVKFISITNVKFTETKDPFIDIYWVFIAYSCWFKKIISIFFSFCLWDIFLDIFIKPNSFVKIDCLQVIEIDIIVYFSKLFYLLFSKYTECFFFRNQSIIEKTKSKKIVHSSIKIILSWLISFVILDRIFWSLHE